MKKIEISCFGKKHTFKGGALKVERLGDLLQNFLNSSGGDMDIERLAYDLAARVALGHFAPYKQAYLFSDGRYVVTVERQEPLEPAVLYSDIYSEAELVEAV